MAWGWRVPFLLSALLVITGLVIRVRVAESPEFDRVKQAHAVVRLPVIEVLRTHPKQVLLVAGASLVTGNLLLPDHRVQLRLRGEVGRAGSELDADPGDRHLGRSASW